VAPVTKNTHTHYQVVVYGWKIFGVAALNWSALGPNGLLLLGAYKI